jgi:hypothetical protein
MGIGVPTFSRLALAGFSDIYKGVADCLKARRDDG